MCTLLDAQQGPRTISTTNQTAQVLSHSPMRAPDSLLGVAVRGHPILPPIPGSSDFCSDIPLTPSLTSPHTADSLDNLSQYNSDASTPH